jgi:predicted lipid-binding transport protein (Tim44 family)
MAMLRGGSNYTQQGFGERAALFGIPQEPSTRINPDAGVNIGLQDTANRANYLANTYAAREQAAGGMAGGLFSGLGSIFGGFLGRDKG